ncbi:MAG TPA: hypothetical protein VIN59_08440 [Alphaproteobacteria bacterium]
MKNQIETEIRALFTAVALSFVGAVPGSFVGYSYAHSDFRTTQLPNTPDHSIAIGAGAISYSVSFLLLMSRRKKYPTLNNRDP